MNGDLISREAAVKLLTDKAYGYYVSMFATSDECHMARVVALEAANEIESLPAVDAVPVVHGRWIDGMKCSACGQIDLAKPNYCPNCGAMMRGKSDEAE